MRKNDDKLGIVTNSLVVHCRVKVRVSNYQGHLMFLPRWWVMLQFVGEVGFSRKRFSRVAGDEITNNNRKNREFDGVT